MEKGIILPYSSPMSQKIKKNNNRSYSVWIPKYVSSISIFIIILFLTWTQHSSFPYQRQPKPSSALETFRQCSIATYLATGLPFLSNVTRPSISEYVLRRNNLATALHASNISAFIVEPGYTFSYYANITQPQWEVWEPEERPFLMIIRPEVLTGRSVGGEEEVVVVANTSFLVPHFEEERARLLDMPFEEGPEGIHMITYEEHWDYYATLYEASIWNSSSSPSSSPPILMVDDEIRDFIPRGLTSANFTVTGLSRSIAAVRQIKTPSEISILRAVNTGTVAAIRAMRSCLLRPGFTENQVAAVLDATLLAAGLEPFFDIVEFGASAALPHGGYDGTRKLESGMFVLIDVGAHLYGYSSDVCRTFYPPFFPPPPPDLNHHHLTQKEEEEEGGENPPPLPSHHHHLQVWSLVLTAQHAAAAALLPNATASSVDLAARSIISAAGYGDSFTHRLGHGIGIKAHESPYLHQGNVEDRLRPGMVFTAEPGVYVLGEFGVRHEDVLVVREEGEGAENLSGGFARSPWEV